MADRYFVDEPIEGRPRVRLTGSEAHHLAHVMRAAAGDAVTLFDGGGAEFSACIEHVGRSEIELVVLSREPIDREWPLPVTLGVALPKGDRQRWLVEKATELGAARLVPLVTRRTGEHQTAVGLERLRRSVIEASKQCGRNHLMEIRPPEKLGDYLAAAPAESLRLIGQPGGASVAPVLDEHFVAARPSGIVLAVGPEGGFTDEEIQSAASLGWQSVDLGPTILRVETAAVALIAAIVTRLDPSDGRLAR